MFFLWIGQYKFVHFGTFWIIFEVKGRFSEIFFNFWKRPNSQIFWNWSSILPVSLHPFGCVYISNSKILNIPQFVKCFSNLSYLLYGQWEKNNDLCTSFLYKKLRIVTFSYKKDTNPQNSFFPTKNIKKCYFFAWKS